MEDLASVIESILFVAAKPLSAKDLAKILDREIAEVTTVLQGLADAISDQGVILLESNGQWQFATNPKNSAAVRAFLNTELREKLTDATVETLAIIAYRQPISRTEIEAVRGVSSQYSIRHLLIRGLIQKIPNPADSRQILYETTIEFLHHMGIQSSKELPDFSEITAKIKLPEAEPAAEPLAESPDMLQ